MDSIKNHNKEEGWKRMTFSAFLVTQGSCSDYGVKAVFKTQAQCIGYIEKQTFQWELMVEDYDDRGLITRWNWDKDEAKLILSWRRTDD